VGGGRQDLPPETESIIMVRTRTSGSATVVRNPKKKATATMISKEPDFGISAPIASPIGSRPILTPIRKRAIPTITMAAPKMNSRTSATDAPSRNT